jgi:multidrug efflux system membrane fusion protein
MKNVPRKAALVLSAALLSACAAEHARAREPFEARIVPVRTQQVQRGAVELPVRASGTLGARHELELSFKVGGVVREVRFEEGARVKKGQLLAAIDPTEIEAQLVQARQTLDKAERDTTRIQALQARGSLPLVDAQNAATGLAVARAVVDATAFNLQHARLVAPESGVLDRRLVHVGEVVAPGRPVFRLSAMGRGTGPVARVSLIDRDLLAIKLGDRGTVTLDARPDTKLAAHVTQIASMASPATGTFVVELTVDDVSAAQLPSGLTVKVEIAHRDADGVRVPVSALVEGHGRDAVVYTLADGRARRVPVVVRQLLGNDALLASPLAGVDSVVASGASLLSDGARVSVDATPVSTHERHHD